LQKEDVNLLTGSAIQHVAPFIPAFAEAKVGAKPLFGAQQIPGIDPTLRVAEVSFPLPSYARCEIVKVSSSIDMVKAIVSELVVLGHLEHKALKHKEWIHTQLIEEEELKVYAREICTDRGYPESMANRNVEKLLPPFDEKEKPAKRVEQSRTYLHSRLQQRHSA
jgi:hypothetical protein